MLQQTHKSIALYRWAEVLDGTDGGKCGARRVCRDAQPRCVWQGAHRAAPPRQAAGGGHPDGGLAAFGAPDRRGRGPHRRGGGPAHLGRPDRGRHSLGTDQGRDGKIAMRIYEYATMSAEERRTVLGRSTADIFSRENLDRVGAIFEEVRRDGDWALVRALEHFDGASITPEEIPIAPEEVEEARRTVPRQVQEAG